MVSFTSVATEAGFFVVVASLLGLVKLFEIQLRTTAMH